MATLTKLIIATLLSLCLCSCNFDFNSGIRGNGNVLVENRQTNEVFHSIEASEGLDVYVTQSNTYSVTVEADENLQELIITDVIDGTLKIHTKKNIGWSKSKKVLVSFKDLSKITSTSGSDVYSTNTIKTSQLELKSTSGSDMSLTVNTNKLNCKSTSGSDLKLSGKTNYLVAEATSGSDIKAGELIAQSSQVKATSGADITVNSIKKLMANASSGGDIKYLGTPEQIEKHAEVSGSINSK
ncbi:head GIN domain-containing protein [Gaetbulibacter saemankumensis]|uniref:head GIN domain-containing protein n=1 Tax=Gaetbulibacter saemankumensis TaxID=311208 RepID=UPI0004006A53|nr:head GIN domain-containing protein [Gaetbulibacter saemankumensis]